MARFLDQSEPVVVLVGMVIPGESIDGDVLVLVEQERTVAAPRELAEFLSYVTAPRRMSELKNWVQEAGGTESDIGKLVRSGRLLQVEPGSGGEVLRAFAGMRVVPLGFPVEVPGASGDVVYIGPDERSTQVRPVSSLLAATMWEQQNGEDLPATVARLVADADLGPDEAGRLVLNGLDALLALGLARLEVVGP